MFSLPTADVDMAPAQSVALLEDSQLADWVSGNADALQTCFEAIDAIEDHDIAAEIAYFSPEFGVAAQIPQYSGGLGILAGDHMKSASDLAIPLVGVGLFYGQGFFRQQIQENVQQETYETVDPHAIGLVDTGITVEVIVAGEQVQVKVWQQKVGARTIYLLDTNIEANSEQARKITDRLYSGDRRHRLHQELILGVGGVRALRALGVAPQVFHLNEGHACLLLLELLAEQREQNKTLDEAVEIVRSQTLFTTHTPVPAGIDRFDRTLIEPYLEPWAQRLGATTEQLFDWATLPSDGPAKPFNTAALAIHLCDRINGVSQLHAKTSRQLFASLPRAQAIEGITNGVHGRTWVDPKLQELYDELLGPQWDVGDEASWDEIGQLSRERYDEVKQQSRQDLVDLVQQKTGKSITSGGPIIGFARRFATYKRAALLLSDKAKLQTILASGAVFLFAGKAHPADDKGKAVLAEIIAYSNSVESQGGIIFLPDYDITIAQHMYFGCDVWLNNPIRPHEASGTSGEKAALNGCLNLSINDGWWADFYQEGIGWVIDAAETTDAVERDLLEAASLYRLLEQEVLPTFADKDAWFAMVKKMLAELGPKVTAGRMVSDYNDRFYGPILQSSLAKK